MAEAPGRGLQPPKVLGNLLRLLCRRLRPGIRAHVDDPHRNCLGLCFEGAGPKSGKSYNVKTQLEAQRQRRSIKIFK